MDLTTIVPSVATSIGGFVGQYTWGPAEIVKTISSEDRLVDTYLEPTDDNAVDFLTAASFLGYSNNLKNVRVVDDAARNGISAGTTSNTGLTAGWLVTNEDAFRAYYVDGEIGIGDDINIPVSAPAATKWVARYPGSVGNTIRVYMIHSRASWKSLRDDVANSSYATKRERDVANAILQRIAGNFPSTTEYAAKFSATGDELHVFVVDWDGKFTGVRGAILEQFMGLSIISDAQTADGLPNFYRDVINQQSRFFYVLSDIDALGTHVGTALVEGRNYNAGASSLFLQGDFFGGDDGAGVSDDDYIRAYNYFANPEKVEVNLLFTGRQESIVALHVIQNIVEVRKDCVVFVSPPRSSVVNVADPMTEIIRYRDAGLIEETVTTTNTFLGYSSSYAVLDGNWKYMFNRYANKAIWVPLSGDLAGLCARTDRDRDAWWSPAGLNRGQLKNLIKLAWNPTEAERDQLYAAGINPVVSLPGRGTVLYGDKTLQSKPSAFDRINVRRLFIVLEVAISRAAQYTLFEFNDQFTRAQFVALVDPFLREVQGRRGIFDYRIVCDTTNNTGEVIDRNEFIGDIYVKPARSINYIRLNFVAVKTGVDFNTVVGAF